METNSFFDSIVPMEDADYKALSGSRGNGKSHDLLSNALHELQKENAEIAGKAYPINVAQLKEKYSFIKEEEVSLGTIAKINKDNIFEVKAHTVVERPKARGGEGMAKYATVLAVKFPNSTVVS